MLVRPRAAPQRGFTLIELMTTVTVLTIVLMIAVPSFRSFTANQKLRSASYALTSALLLARSQAIAQNGPVLLQPNTGGWDQGWTVRDKEGDGAHIFASHGALPSLKFDPNPGTITYGRDGRLIKTGDFESLDGVEFNIKPADPSSQAQVSEYCVFISPSGLPSAAKGDAC